MNKSIAIYVAALMSFALTPFIRAQDNDLPVLKGPYLGQKPPGVYPEIFAPGIISVDANFEHSAAVFSPDGNEVFWCTNIDWYTENKQQGMLRLYFMKMIDGQWTPPQMAQFVKDKRVERPVFSPDGKRLYMEFSVDPVDPDNNDIFFVARKGEGWSEPKSVSPLINSPAFERLHCITPDGSLYFSRSPMTSNEELLVSRLVDGEFTEPEVLGERFNSEDPELAIVFGPNEEFMLIDQKDTQYNSHLYISYKNSDGTWTERIKTPYECGGFLSLSPDGKYLFFLGDGIYWIDTSFVDELRPK
jgi:hypothetical protein